MNTEIQQDDTSILENDRLFRRVPVNQLFREEDGSYRPSSALFAHTKMSVNIESLMIEQGRPPEDTLSGYPDNFLLSITAGSVRKFGHSIVKDTALQHDPAHGLVLGKKCGSFKKEMCRSFQWIVAPQQE
jgi:hypothetical protein